MLLCSTSFMQACLRRGVCPKTIGVCPGFARGLPRGLPNCGWRFAQTLHTMGLGVYARMAHAFASTYMAHAIASVATWYNPTLSYDGSHAIACTCMAHAIADCASCFKGNLLYDRSAQGHGFARGLRPRAKPCPCAPLAWHMLSLALAWHKPSQTVRRGTR